MLAYKGTFMLAQNFPSLQQFPLLLLLQRSKTNQTIHTGLSNLKKTLMSSVVFCLQNRVFWQPLHAREDLQADGTVLFTLKKRVCVCWEALTLLMARMELQKVNIEPDGQSNSGESLEDNYTEPADSEKAAISR